MANKIYLFNPDCELAIVNGSKYYMPPSNVAMMAKDLSFLPAYLSANGDCVLCEGASGAAFANLIRKILGIDCRGVTWQAINDLKSFEAEPWGWSPKECHRFEGFSNVEPWHSERKELYSREKARECLEWLLNALPFVEKEVLPQVCRNITEVETIINNGRYIIKAPWSSSGRGLLVVRNKLSSKEKEWLGGILKRHGFVMIEKYQKRIYDFAMEFYTDGSKVSFIGLSEFYTGKNGEYKGNYLGPHEGIENRLNDYLSETVLRQTKQQLTVVLSNLFRNRYKGYFGVDMMVYEDISGNLRIQPCLEINLRYNMGIIALVISQRYLAKNTSGIFSVLFFPKTGDALTYHDKQQADFPLIHERGKIISGYMNLTPVSFDNHFIAVMHLHG